MLKKKRTRLRLEELESRLVPTVSATYYAGSLYLTGSTQGQLAITGLASPYQFSVTDNGNAVGAGTYNLTSNLNINLTLEKGNVMIDLAGDTIGGNVVLGLGTGWTAAQNVDIFDSTGSGILGAGTGTIGGSVTITKGNGKEAFGIGVDTNAMMQEPFNLDGGLTIAASSSNSSLTGNGLQIGDGTNIFGSVGTTYVSNVSIGSSTTGNLPPTISAGVTINDSGSLCHLSVVDNGILDQTLNVTGTTLDDSFTLQQVTAGGGFIGGTTNISLGQGQSAGDRILLGPNTEIDANTYLSAGDNLNATTGDQFSIQGSILLNLNVSMGNTTNSVIFTNMLGNPVPYVGGNMSVTAGNGTNFIGQRFSPALSPVGEFNGTVGGNLTFQLGSGNNGTSADPMIIASAVGGTLTWTSGNGQDFLQLGDFSTSGMSYNFYVNIHFGNKDDTFIMDLGTGVITGTVNGGDRVVANHFIPLSGSTGTPFSSPNFP